jgi:pyruvate/2-oxoglutarate dehydrogenase complex dihydrolipoamide acyltransferase (E2) component
MPDAVVVHVPQLNVNDEVIKIVSWRIACGGRVAKGQPLVEVETGKATAEIAAPAAGFVQYAHGPDDEVSIGDVLCTISPVPLSADASPPATESIRDNKSPGNSAAVRVVSAAEAVGAPPLVSVAPVPAITVEPEPPAVARFSARARARLEAHGIDPATFPGSGLVRERDVLLSLSGDKGHAPAVAQKPPGEAADKGPVRSEPLSRQKLREIRVLSSSYASVLPSSVTVACPTTGFRRAAAQEASLRGNATALIVFEAARLLRQYPVFNGYLREQQACYYDRVNIGFAVDAGRGLKVLVVQDADKKTAGAIADEMHALVGQYLEDRLPLAALSGGTFTITDLSGEGVATFAPLINEGQSAILGVGAERILPPHEVGDYNLILAFDHRLSDGRTAARFLNALRERLSAHEAALRPAQATSGVGRNDLCCSRCLRTANELERLAGSLVRGAVHGEYLCTLCLSGL